MLLAEHVSTDTPSLVAVMLLGKGCSDTRASACPEDGTSSHPREENREGEMGG